MGPDDFMKNYASYSPFVNRLYYSMSYTWFIIPWDPTYFYRLTACFTVSDIVF